MKKELPLFFCKQCKGTLAFPGRLTTIQAKLHKRKYPLHEVGMIL